MFLKYPMKIFNFFEVSDYTYYTFGCQNIKFREHKKVVQTYINGNIKCIKFKYMKASLKLITMENGTKVVGFFYDV